MCAWRTPAFGRGLGECSRATRALSSALVGEMGQSAGAAVVGKLGRRSPSRLFLRRTSSRGRQPVTFVLLLRRSAAASTSNLRSLVAVRRERLRGRLRRLWLRVVVWRRPRRRRPSVVRRRIRVTNWHRAGSQGLSVCAKQLGARRHSTRNGRDGDKSRRARARDGLEYAFLVHPGTVLALSAWRVLVAAAPDLERQVSHDALQQPF